MGVPGPSPARRDPVPPPRRGREGGRLEPPATGRLDGDRPPPSVHAAEGRVVVTGQQGRASIGGDYGTPLPGAPHRIAGTGQEVRRVCRASSHRPRGPSFHPCRRVKLEFAVNSSHAQLSHDPVGGGVDHVHVILGMQSEAARTRITTPESEMPDAVERIGDAIQATTGRSRRSRCRRPSPNRWSR